MSTPRPGRCTGWRRAAVRGRALGRAGAAWWLEKARPASCRAAGRLRDAGAALGPSARRLAVRAQVVLRAGGLGLAGLAARLRSWRPGFGPGPVLAALPLAGVGAALAGTLTVGGLVSVGAVVAAVALGAWLAGECLAAGLRAAEDSAWTPALLAGGAGLVLSLVACALAVRFTPSLALWAVAASCLVTLGLWGSRLVPEAHLAWAVALAFLPALGWEGAGGAPPAPVLTGWWALLLAGGHALAWAAGRGGPAARLRLRAARLCHLASPFLLLALVGERPLGLAFVAGVVVAGFLQQGGHLFARAPDSAPGRGLPFSLALGGLAVVTGILMGAAGLPR